MFFLGNFGRHDMSRVERAIVVVETLLVDKNAPDLEYLVECNTTRERLLLPFFDGKLSQHSYH